MKKPKQDPIREDRIHNEAIVDAYGPEEQALGWYYYLENKIRFPFQAKCVVAKVVSPLLKGETVEVRRMAPEDACSSDMLVLITLAGPKHGRPFISTGSTRGRRINHRSHWGLALLGSARLLLLNRSPSQDSNCACLPKAHKLCASIHKWVRRSSVTMPLS
jgi:hypothetical protein